MDVCCGSVLDSSDFSLFLEGLTLLAASVGVYFCSVLIIVTSGGCFPPDGFRALGFFTRDLCTTFASSSYFFSSSRSRSSSSLFITFCYYSRSIFYIKNYGLKLCSSSQYTKFWTNFSGLESVPALVYGIGLPLANLFGSLLFYTSGILVYD